MKRGLCCLFLFLLLTGCGGEPAQQAEETAPPPLLGSAAGLNENITLLIVDGREVQAWRYLYWLGRACDVVWAEYEAAGTVPDWTADTGGRTLAEYTAERALADTLLYATVETMAARHGCGGDTESGVRILPQPELGLDEARAAELDCVGRMYAQLYTLFCTEGSALFPTEETLAAFSKAHGWTGFASICIPFGEDKASARKTAEELFSRLNSAADAAAEFEALAAETGGTHGCRTVQLGAQMLDDALEDALSSLEEGQYSGILETKEGFVILLRCAPDPVVMMEPCFDDLLQRSAAGAKVQSAAVYETVDVPAFCRVLRQLREERNFSETVTKGNN